MADDLQPTSPPPVYSQTRIEQTLTSSVLAWNLSETHDSSVHTPSRPSRYPPPSQPSLSGPFGNPPEYNAAQTLAHPVVYTFSPSSSNSMALVPPATAIDTRPRYHISVSMNCFIPSSYITSIRRGASEHGETAAEFEMGISNRPSTLSIRGKEHKIADVFIRKDACKLGIWIWKFDTHPFIWDCRKGNRICYSKGRKAVYAKFHRAKGLRNPGEPAELTQLEVFPAGQELLDDILLSALIIERWRLTPTSGDNKGSLN